MYSGLIKSVEKSEPAADDGAKLVDFLHSCEDQQRIKARGSQPIVQFLRQKFGAFLHPIKGEEGDLTELMTGERTP